MRTIILATVLASACIGALPLAGPLQAAEGGRPTFINAHLSSRKIALNEAVRVEFTTMPREVEHVDIAAAVANALRLGNGASWRLIGKPQVTEQAAGAAAPADPAKPAARERPKPITVVFSLLPRVPGDLQLPDIPMTWLQGNQVAHFDVVVVDPSIKVGGNDQDLPKEASGVAGFAWNSAFASLKDRIPADQVENAKDRILVHPQKNLTLEFIGGVLAQATLTAPGLSLEQARLEFLKRWGVPQLEDANALTWIIGWTRITATPDADRSGIVVALVREDIQANLDRTQVSAEVFGVLDGPVQETKEQAESRKAKEIKQELDRPAVPAR
jgi:hypothetical protein